MKKRPKEKPSLKDELIDIGFVDEDGGGRKPGDLECPICKQPVGGPEPFCLRCDGKLSTADQPEVARIVEYFDRIEDIMEGTRQTIEKQKIRTKLVRIDKELRKNLENPDLWFKKGVIFNGLGADEKALSSFNSALDINPLHCNTLIAKGYTLSRMSRFREAGTCYQKALDSVLRGIPQKTPPIPPKWPDEEESLTALRSDDVIDLKRMGLVNGLGKGARRKKMGLVNGLTNGLTNGVRGDRRGLTNGLTNGLKSGKMGMTNGLTNGLRRGKMGMTNGLTNGITNGLKRGKMGMTNGLTNGLTNGITNGLTNGLRHVKIGLTNGVTDGNGITNGLGKKKGILGAKGRPIRYLILPIIIVIAVLFPQILNLINTQEEMMSIDGDFGDWEGVDSNSDAEEGMGFNPNIDITEFRVIKEPGQVSFLIEVDGTIMSGQPENWGNLVDILHILIDVDQELNTGYKIRGIGADYMIRIYGWKGSVERTELLSFDGFTQDWNNWVKYGHASVVAKENKLEAQVSTYNINLENGHHIDCLFHMMSWNGFEDFSDYAVSDSGGVLAVAQQAQGEGVISGSANTLLSLEFEAIGEDILLEEITFTRTGAGTDSDVKYVRIVDGGAIISMRSIRDGKVTFEPNLLISQGDKKTLNIEVDLDTMAQMENSIGFKVDNTDDMVTDRGTVSLSRLATPSGSFDISYIDDIPHGVKIDGAFADWQDKNRTSDSLSDVIDKNLDISEYAVYSSPDILAFYIQVDGRMVGGVDVPFENEIKVIKEKLVTVSPRDKDRDGIWDETDLYPNDFDNDGLIDANDVDDDNDGAIDYTSGGPDNWLVQKQTGVRIYIGPLPSPPPATGDDVIDIFLDSDNDIMTGYPVAGLGADVLLEIKGKHGDVTQAICFDYTGSEHNPWAWDFLSVVESKVDFTRLEVGSKPAEIGITDDFRMFVRTHNWNNESYDDTKPILGGRGTRTPQNDNVVINEVYPTPGGGDKEWIEFYNPTGSDIDLNGWYLDSASKFGTFQFSNSTVVAANSYLVIDETWFGANFFTPTDSLTLYDDGTNNIDYTSWGNIDNSSNTWARYYDSQSGEPYDSDQNSDWYESTSPTPGAQNDQSIPEFQVILPSILFVAVCYMFWRRKTKPYIIE